MKKLTASVLIAAVASLSAPLTFAAQGSTPGVSAVQTSANENTGGIAPSQGTGALGGIGLGTLLTTIVIIAAVAEVSDGDDSTTGTTN